MNLLDRYLSLKVAGRTGMVALVFALVFAAWSLAAFLAQAADGALKPGFVASMVLTKVAIASDVILPVALYIGVILTVSALRQTSESTALLACGYGAGQVALGLLPLFTGFAVLVGFASLMARPILYERLYESRTRAETAFDFEGLEAGRFYAGADGDRVVFADRVDGTRLERVFVWNRRGNSDVVLRADSFLRLPSDGDGTLFDVDGLRVYRFRDDRWTTVASAGTVTTTLDFEGETLDVQRRKETPTGELGRSDDPEDQAEWQWRGTRPLAAVLMGLLALRLSGFSRREQSRWRSALLTIVVCLLYNLASLTVRTWVKDGVIPLFPGLWGVEAVVALGLLASVLPGFLGRSLS